MEKKTPKRKLIGFLAGEKGSIGKLQALGLGIAGMIGSGLMPKVVHGYNTIGIWSDAAWSYGVTWDYVTPYNDYGDGLEPHFDSPAWSYSYGPNPGWSDSGGGWSNAGWSNGGWEDYGDWTGDWLNAPPTVEIRVE